MIQIPIQILLLKIHQNKILILEKKEKFQIKIQEFQIGKEIQKNSKTPLLKNILKMIYLLIQLQKWNKKKIIYLQKTLKLKEFNKELKI